MSNIDIQINHLMGDDGEHTDIPERNYLEFIAGKRQNATSFGFKVEAGDIHPSLFLFQRHIVQWALARGRAAIFAECGLGKTRMQLEWAREVAKRTAQPVLMFAPVGVKWQTAEEALLKLGYKVPIAQSQDDVDVTHPLWITNYERLHLFDLTQFAGVVLDESSILKSFTGKTRTALIDACSHLNYRLCCTATPSPNDQMELGNHSEFLGIKTSAEMLATWFKNDASDTGTWRLKHAAEGDRVTWRGSGRYVDKGMETELQGEEGVVISATYCNMFGDVTNRIVRFYLNAEQCVWVRAKVEELAHA